ncbi:MAG: UbiH/UbiF/VisC/COQ6 family ubiquinone biosynthesis hydroxylase [Alphaproteobacteria bacterium]|nr:UbiH/UbiF/VisC/COQ6 family ubiquinone biosynthesis hydroxylase [Alphaproteobacteria bacterium]
MESHDIIIAGGGLVGNALALALAQGGLNVVVIDPIPAKDQIETSFDGRTSAIALGSVRILEHIGAWNYIAPNISPIHDIRVCDGFAQGFVHYHDKDVGDEPFGYIIENHMIRRGLYKKVTEQSGITMLSGLKVTDYETFDTHVVAKLDNGRELKAPLLVAADGRFSGLRDKAGIDYRIISYDQTAIVCVMEHENPHQGLALERFMPAGPFAVLPLIDDAHGTHRSGIVWTEHEDDAAHYMKLSDDEFNAELARRSGEYWGKVKAVGKRFAYPLKLQTATEFIASRFVLVGDAAHGIHPIAGQGVNLGYRDVAVLSELLIEQHQHKRDLGDAELLKHYQRWRKFDSVSMTASTDLLNRLFSNRSPSLAFLRRTGLKMVERMPPLKHFFMRHAMGLIGDLPKMMEPPKKVA